MPKKVEVNITFLHSEASPALQDHILTKLERLKKYFINATTAHVILKVEGPRHIAEITLAEHHQRFYAHEGSEDMYRSVNAALAKLERQLKQHKEQVKSHHKARGCRGADFRAP